MASRNGWLSLISVGLLATMGTAGSPRRSGALASLESVKPDYVSYRMAVFGVESPNPTVIAAKVWREGARHWRLCQGWVETVVESAVAYTAVADIWNVEEMVELSIHPVLHFKAAAESAADSRHQASQAFSFRLDRTGYPCQVGSSPDVNTSEEELAKATCSGSGEIEFIAQRLVERVLLRLKASSSEPKEALRVLQVRVLGFAGDSELESEWNGLEAVLGRRAVDVNLRC